MKSKHVFGKCTMLLLLGMLFVTSCAIMMTSDIDRKWFGRSEEKGGITAYYKPKVNDVSVIDLEITNYGADSLKLNYNSDEYTLNTTYLAEYKGPIAVKLKPSVKASKYPKNIEPFGRIYIRLKGYNGDYKLIDNIIVKFESGEKTIFMNRSYTQQGIRDIEKQLLDKKRQDYETNYYNVLSWAKEGMNESEIFNKIGTIYARMYLDSTYSSMSSTVAVYKFGQVYSPSGGYGRVDVWLTFIDGKLSSISTFDR